MGEDEELDTDVEKLVPTSCCCCSCCSCCSCCCCCWLAAWGAGVGASPSCLRMLMRGFGVVLYCQRPLGRLSLNL